MTGSENEPPPGWPLAVFAATLFAVDPVGTGLCLHAGAGPQRDRWLDVLRRMMPDAPLRKIPHAIADDRLLGGLDLTATLAAGRTIAERGLLAEADGGAVVIPSAERMPAAVAARIAAVHDAGHMPRERDGLALRSPARFGLVLLDEAIQDDERPPAALMDRMAFCIDLSGIAMAEIVGAGPAADDIAAARLRLPGITAGDADIEALCMTAAALGIGSARAPLLALRAARIAAALRGGAEVGEADLRIAARMVLSWRAQILPVIQPESEAQDEPSPQTSPDDAEDFDNTSDPDTLTDIVLNAARTALPPDLLARITMESAQRHRSGVSGQSGAQRKATTRGRPIGTVAGQPRGGRRLDLIATLRAAAPWQRLRQRRPDRLAIRSADFRIRRFAERSETLTIFAVDASGSQALNRMAEAKGAVELLLADCYIRRDQVALIAFRGPGSEVLLPPTRSLLRARRSLSGLPAGGGTPLALGIDAAAALAHAAARRGQTPLIVLLTDGRANIARDGLPNRALAQEDAAASAKALRRAGWRTLFIDTSPQPEPRAVSLAETMGALYIALPRLNAGALSAAVQGMHAGIGTRRHG